MNVYKVRRKREANSMDDCFGEPLYGFRFFYES
jgi:hypothetical protein